jgi:hypothetical protein
MAIVDYKDQLIRLFIPLGLMSVGDLDLTEQQKKAGTNPPPWSWLDYEQHRRIFIDLFGRPFHYDAPENRRARFEYEANTRRGSDGQLVRVPARLP